MSHSNHDFLYPAAARIADQLIHAGDEALAALKRKAFLPNELSREIALKAFCRGNPIQNLAFFFDIKIRR